jgi:sugar phosphate isomerase/epimerase
MDMRISVSSYSFHYAFKNGYLNTLKFPGWCAENYPGVDVELFTPDFFWERDGGSAPTFEDVHPGHKYVQRVVEAYEEAGVSILAISAQNDFTREDGDKRLRDILGVSRWLDLGKALGAKFLRINSGDGFGQDDRACDRLVEGLNRVVPKARDCGIELVLENHPRNLTSDLEAERLIQVVERVGDHIVGTCPDNGAFTKSGDDEEDRALCRECLRTLFRRAKHCHVKFSEFGECGEEKTIDYNDFFGIVRELEYKGAFSIEAVAPFLSDAPFWWLKVTDETLEKLEQSPGVSPGEVMVVSDVKDDVFESTEELLQVVRADSRWESTRTAERALLEFVKCLDPMFERHKRLVTKAVELLRAKANEEGTGNDKA